MLDCNVKLGYPIKMNEITSNIFSVAKQFGNLMNFYRDFLICMRMILYTNKNEEVDFSNAGE